MGRESGDRGVDEITHEANAPPNEGQSPSHKKMQKHESVYS